MKKRREYSIELSGKIQILSEGYIHEKIARRLKIPKSRVAYTLASFKNTGTNATRKRCGRLKCTYESEDKQMYL